MLAISALLIGKSGHAADHLDAPNLFTGTSANPMADIGDVYTWMSSDKTKINLAMTFSPADDGTRHFSPAVQYVFHVTEYAGATNDAAYNGHQGTEHKVICTFASDTSAQCWVATGSTILDYVKGNPSATAGITSTDGKVKLFAGHRSDPFFFNLGGFKTAVHDVEIACGNGTTTTGACPGSLTPALNAAGCPQLPAAALAAPVAALSAQNAASAITAPCSGTVKDCFASFNVMAIVLQIDTSLVVGTNNHLVSVWGSTHMGS